MYSTRKEALNWIKTWLKDKKHRISLEQKKCDFPVSDFAVTVTGKLKQHKICLDTGLKKIPKPQNIHFRTMGKG